MEEGAQQITEINVVEKKDPNAGKVPYYLGAHVSAAGGAFNAVVNASQLKANAFALFLKYDRAKMVSVQIAASVGDGSYHRKGDRAVQVKYGEVS